MGGGLRGNRESYAIRRPGAPQLITNIGKGQHLINQYNGLPYQNVIFSGQQQMGLQQKLENGSLNILLSAMIHPLIITFPIIGVVYTSYKIAKWVCPIIKTSLLTYSQTSDWNETFENVIKETGRQIIKTLIGMFTNFVYGTITNIKIKNNLGLNIIG